MFTNTLPIALALAAKPNVTVYTLGGRVRNITLAEVDAWAARTLGEINVDVAFLGANGISPRPRPHHAGPRRSRRQAASCSRCARRRILLADHSKINQVSTHKYGELADLDLLITDTGITRGRRRRP